MTTPKPPRWLDLAASVHGTFVAEYGAPEFTSADCRRLVHAAARGPRFREFSADVAAEGFYNSVEGARVREHQTLRTVIGSFRIFREGKKWATW